MKRSENTTEIEEEMCWFCEGELISDKGYSVCDKCLQYVEIVEDYVEWLLNHKNNLNNS